MEFSGLILHPDPVLSTDHSTPLDYRKGTREMSALAAHMHSTMYKYDGVGIAAVQVNVPIPMCFVEEELMINPTVEFMSMTTNLMKEGCLSCPGYEIPIFRSDKITVTYLDINATKHTKILKGLSARIFLHEHDHIRGKLIKDYSAVRL